MRTSFEETILELINYWGLTEEEAYEEAIKEWEEK